MTQQQEAGDAYLDAVADIRPAVYFVRRGGPDGLIKIGVTSSGIRQRLATIRATLRGSDGASDSLELLLLAPGDRRVERRTHERFRHLRQHGEWFLPDAELLRFIGDSRLDPSLVTGVPAPGKSPGTPWNRALVDRVEDRLRRTGEGPCWMGAKLDMPSISAELDRLRAAQPVRMTYVERLAEGVECELVLVPKRLVPQVNRLIESEPAVDCEELRSELDREVA